MSAQEKDFIILNTKWLNHDQKMKIGQIIYKENPALMKQSGNRILINLENLSDELIHTIYKFLKKILYLK